MEKIELSEQHRKRRLIAAALFLAIGAVAIAYGFFLLVAGDSGWREIESAGSGEINCAGDFVFMYNVGASGVAAATENRALTALYTEATVTAYRLFTVDERFDGVNNMAAINAHPNEELEVDGVLYEALAAFVRHGRRELYLGPVVESYDDIFFAVDDVYARELDPYLNEEAAAYYAQIAAYARQSAHVDVQLLGDNRIKLFVSDEYLRFARENEITAFIDFAWTKNAFIADFLAETILANGYTLGVISSFDGFSRSLTEEGISYSLKLYDRVEQAVFSPAVMEYSSPTAIVSLRNFPASGQDLARYYTYASGAVRSLFLDVQDGRCKSTIDSLTGYSQRLKCAEILMELIPVYISERFDGAALIALSGEGLHSIWREGSVLRYTDPALTLTNLYEGESFSCTAQLVS